MSLVRYEPWRRFGQMQNDINRAFSFLDAEPRAVKANTWTPAVDVTEYKDRYVLAIELPGIAPDSVEITLEDGVLDVHGERPETKEDEDIVYRRAERRAGKFQRRFQLPESVDTEKVGASNHNGILEIVVPKQEKAKPRRIEVAA